LIALSVHLTASIVSLYNTIPLALAITAFIVGFLFAVSEAAAAYMWRRGFTVGQPAGEEI
jgi:uncharacterized membrane protein